MCAGAVTQLPPPQQPPQPPPSVARYGAGIPTQPPKKKRLPTWALIFGAIALVCCGGTTLVAIVNGISGEKPTASNAERPAAQTTTVTETTQAAPPATTEAAPPPPPAGPATNFGPGTYEVGVDIKAGSYTCTAGEIGGYWERAKNASGELTAVIANGIIEEHAKAIVAVKTKEFFKIQMATCVIR